MTRAGLLLAAAACMISVSEAKRKYNTTAGYVPGKINVHIVPHTHDDVGWLKTVDEYFLGANNSIQHAAVQYILDSVLVALQKNPDRKFIYVEQAFFQRWMAEADDEDAAAMRQVVANGQLEFINGGWCMHDEAAPSYIDMIDQTTLGTRLINQAFGKTVNPLTQWQIDPFGHSATHQSLMTAASGYISLFFGRADSNDRTNRDNNQNLEFIWQTSTSQPNLASFTGLIPGYGPPGNLCFDLSCSPIPFQDDPALEDYNVDYMVDVAVNAALSMASNYKVASDGTLHLMWTMGSDFQHENSNEWFKQLDKLIHYGNINGTNGGPVNFFYSTPSLYTKAKLAQDITWSVTTNDFFPYGDQHNHSLWTGYFTSRSALKGYVRETSSVMQTSRQLQLATGGAADLGPDNNLYLLERAMGVLQHHDAVSGTSKQHVAFDYARRLAGGRLAADAGNAQALAQLTGYGGASFSFCDLSNATICPALEAGQAAVVIVYNPQSIVKLEHVRLSVGIPSGVASYTVVDATGLSIVAQITPVSAADTSLRTSYYKAAVAPTAWLTFNAPAVPAVGYSAYFITPSATAAESPLTTVSKPRKMRTTTSPTLRAEKAVGDQTLTNGIVTLTISAATGMLSGYANSQSGVTAPVVQEWLWYNSSVGNSVDGQPSGAYIFRPNSSTPLPVSASPATVTLVTGPVVNEARIVVSDWVTQVVRLWTNSSHVEVEWTVGPIPMSDNLGKEVISRYSTGWNTAKTWYTDSNGREGQQRIRDYRQTWNYTVEEPIAGNYYPVNLWTTTKDTVSGNVFGVVVDRTQGGSSIMDGSLELMIHRRLTDDDRRGVGEPLNEPGLDWNGKGLIVRGTHRLLFDTAAQAPASLKHNAQDMIIRPLYAYAGLNGATPTQWIAANNASFTGVTAPLPENVHLLTAHAQGPNQLLVRLAHLYEINEDPVLSQNVTVDLSNLFTSVTITSCTETTLIANQVLSQAPTYTLRIEGEETPRVFGAGVGVEATAPAGEALSVTLTPMQIRTFKCATTLS